MKIKQFQIKESGVKSCVPINELVGKCVPVSVNDKNV